MIRVLQRKPLELQHGGSNCGTAAQVLRSGYGSAAFPALPSLKNSVSASFCGCRACQERMQGFASLSSCRRSRRCGGSSGVVDRWSLFRGVPMASLWVMSVREHRLVGPLRWWKMGIS